MAKLVLHYKDLEYQGVYQLDHQESNAIYPEQDYGTCLMDYDYEIWVDSDLIAQFIKEQYVGVLTFNTWTKEKQQGFMAALEYCERIDLFCDMDMISEFNEWALDHFKEQAQEQCHEDYDE